eukprot:GEMP01106103.1.p1 GENE.GEMP01106103.1~~GEMP01106103.1.p1  ORF type:complete len:106 (-),score=6.31 GEMP01106103.1:152-469(-)
MVKMRERIFLLNNHEPLCGVIMVILRLCRKNNNKTTFIPQFVIWREIPVSTGEPTNNDIFYMNEIAVLQCICRFIPKQQVHVETIKNNDLCTCQYVISVHVLIMG